MSGKTALVLSAGGMFGAYQVGVWQVLQSVFRPDLVVGASIGSLNGWVIAGGGTAEDLAEHWRNVLAGSGFVLRSRAQQWIQELFRSYTPQTEYGLVTTELPTFDPKLFTWPGLTWQHLAGSCAVPLMFRQHQLEGRAHIDGGLVWPLPLWAAVRLGATRIVAVDLLHHRPPLLRGAAWIAQRFCRFTPNGTEAAQVVSIYPNVRLGSARDSMYWRREATERYLELGRADALQSKHLVVECLGRQSCQSTVSIE